MQHKEIPATLHYERPNPEIDFENSPFYVTNRLSDWTPPPGVPRRAGVSSFGVGGTNVHLVLEEAPSVAPSQAPRRTWQVLPLSAKSKSSLETMTEQLAAHCRHHTDQSHADVAATLQRGREDFDHRRVVVARDLGEAAGLLEGKRFETSDHSSSL